MGKTVQSNQESIKLKIHVEEMPPEDVDDLIELIAIALVNRAEELLSERRNRDEGVCL